MDKGVSNELTIEQKVKLIRCIENGESCRSAAKKFNVSKSTASNIFKRRDYLLAQYEENQSINRCRKLRKTENEEINNAVWAWFERLRSINVPISGPMIKAAALEFNELFNKNYPDRLTYFQASDGWLRCFKQRHNIKFKHLSGESFDAPFENAEEYKKKLPEICKGFKKEDIFNADETALYFRALPSKSLCLSIEKCSGLKDLKDRITILLAVSNTGEWLTPLVIGKSNRPRSFRHLDISKLPVIWRANKSAWMTSLIFTEWLQGINKLMISQQRKILLFIDNCTAHPHMNLSNVELKFFPVNTTSLLQPLDQGIIQNFKTIYRKYFLKSVIASTMVCNSATEIAKSISILDAIHMIKRAVDEIKQSTVMNCFAKAGFSEFQEILEIDIESKKIKELLCEFEESITESVYTSFDNKVPISESIEVESAVERIFEEIIQENISNENREKQVDDEDEEDPDSKFIPSHQDAYQMVQLLKKYATEQGNQEMMRAICFFECEHNSHIVEIHKKSRQMEITDYFSLV